MKSIAMIIGTRPEAVKCSPLVHAFRDDKRFDFTLVATGQHREMLHDALRSFGEEPDIDLDVMTSRQTITSTTYRALHRLEQEIGEYQFDALVVYGDTASSLVGALYGFQNGIPVVHIEAGLRSGDISSPFPEEGNRKMISCVSSLHLAPTARNKENLIHEGVSDDSVVVTGNTIVDVLYQRRVPIGYSQTNLSDLDDDPRKIVFVSAHRRESWDDLPEIANAMVKIAAAPNIRVIAPIHSNPKVRDKVLPKIDGYTNISIVTQLPYLEYCRVLDRSDVILTDSNGAEEEGPTLGKPTLVLRDYTERTEGIEAGFAQLVNKRSSEEISKEVFRHLQEQCDSNFSRKSTQYSPYGDGTAVYRIKSAVASFTAENEDTTA